MIGLLAVGCGRGGLGDFDGFGAPGPDAAIDGGDDATDEAGDDAIGDDAEPPPPDDAFPDDLDVPPTETGVVEPDTGVIGSDTALADSVTVDSLLPPDTAPVDTGVIGPDTSVVDTSVVDTSVVDSGFIGSDTSVVDSGVIGSDSSVVDSSVTDSVVVLPDTAVSDSGIVLIDAPLDGPPPEGGTLCGGAYCNAATQVCCTTFGGASCVAKGSCTGGLPVACSSTASCPTGQVCCASGFGGGLPSVTCQAFCAGARLCATSAECSLGQTYRLVFGGYRVCR